MHQWSVWKRYSEFEQLHAKLKVSLTWQLNNIELPSAYRLTYNKLSKEFVEQRREDLKVYWTKITSINLVTDFTKHHASDDLKEFLNVEEALKKVRSKYRMGKFLYILVGQF